MEEKCIWIDKPKKLVFKSNVSIENKINKATLLAIDIKRISKYLYLYETDDSICLMSSKLIKLDGTRYDKYYKVAKLMEQEHYAVYQCNGRDWVKNSATGRLIGYDIKELVTGKSGRPQGMTLDHMAETFNEMEKNKQFSSNNINAGSHRVKVQILTDNGLNNLITKIIQNNGQPGGIFI